ncbi:hypothetical protein RMN56_17785 [Micromonospora halotolerans]|uniref:Uncharacterized protein n=1 Tax=Micromonospora halotolerans TaxID=709879 RepID=A0ABY9ZPJ3_9ACTN|nr:hypothetical protein [Micromonospora halotolerans]WNM37043.1 hypothetical protein RMN56_17785 [Micromonospora halotolerans]
MAVAAGWYNLIEVDGGGHLSTSEAITLLVAVVSAAAAIVAALFAGSQAVAATQQSRYSQEQLMLAEQVRKDQAQPYVFADLRPDEQDPQKIMLVVQNTGMTVAKKVRVSFDPPLQSVYSPDFAETVPALLGPIATLPPGRRLQWLFDIGFRLFEATDNPRRYNVTINADGPFGPVEELSYDIDLNDLRRHDASTSAPKKIADELKKARTALDKIAVQQQKIVARLPAPEVRPEDPPRE